MFWHKLSRFDQQVVTIHPGEFYATRKDAIISTVLGSCVSVGLFDSVSGIGGLNHFMLPGEMQREELIVNPNARYGMYAMELLINELLKMGLPKACMKAKIFGGGSVLRLPDGSATRIPRSNVDFAFEYLRKESIPVLASDVGGLLPRKIYFFPRTGRVLLKRIGGAVAGLVEREEETYLEGILSSPGEGSITLFR
ncbi:MAG: chemotaxis protein CheD [Rectinemataceae bacterium]